VFLPIISGVGSEMLGMLWLPTEYLELEAPIDEYTDYAGQRVMSSFLK
jgi:hypothetical protein